MTHEDPGSLERDPRPPVPPESGEPQLAGGWRGTLSLFLETGIFRPEEWPIRRLLSASLLLALGVFLFAVASQGVAHVREDSVGVMVNKLTGRLTLKDRVGYHLFIPYLARFYVLDKTIQKLDLTWAQAQRVGAGGRDLKLKTIDGSEVSLDVSINYKLIPSEAVAVLRKSGQGSRFMDLWIESFARHVCLTYFSQLTSEELYDAELRSEKSRNAQTEINRLLNPYGIEVIAVIPGEFRFYQEYEQVIQQKKLADQQTEEQQAQARAALKDQERQLVEAQKKAEAELAAFRGESDNRLITAQAEAERTRREAEGYYSATIMGAEADLYAASSEAAGKRTRLLADAEAMEQLRQAMSGDGGRRMVGMEYARQLGRVRLSGSPVTRDGHIQQFSVQSESAAPVVVPRGMQTQGLPTQPPTQPSFPAQTPGQTMPPSPPSIPQAGQTSAPTLQPGAFLHQR